MGSLLGEFEASVGENIIVVPSVDSAGQGSLVTMCVRPILR